MPTIGKKKKSKKGTLQPASTKQRPTRLPKSGFKRVARAITDPDYYDLSNDETLSKYFNKDGSLKKSALRSERARKEFVSELAKAKQEIKELQKENQKLKEELKQQRQKQKKDRQKKCKAKETYKQNKHGYTQEQYDDFIDILSDVYDEVALIFYDSDQIMQMIDDDNYSYEDIVNLLISINKEKENSLTDVEKKLARKKKKHLSREEQQATTNEVAQMIYLSTLSNLSPEEWFTMYHTDTIKFNDELLTVLPKREREKFLKDLNG